MCVKAGGYTQREHANNVLIDFLKDYGFSEASYLREGTAKNIDTTAKTTLSFSSSRWVKESEDVFGPQCRAFQQLRVISPRC